MLRVKSNRDHGECVLNVVGMIDLASVEEFRGALLGMADGAERMVDVDASRVTYIYSDGLGVLLEAHHRLKERGGRLRIVNPSVTLRRLLQLTRLDRVLEIVESSVDGAA